MPRPDGFNQFVETHGDAVIRAARLLTGDWHSGSDLAQESLVRLYLAWPRLEEPAAAWAYLRRTMVRLHVRARARFWNREQPTASMPENPATPPPTYDDELMAALHRLPTRQRITVVLRFFLDLSVEETAASMGCSTGTVKSQTTKALSSLRTSVAVPQDTQVRTT